jgi:hypothetical protein
LYKTPRCLAQFLKLRLVAGLVATHATSKDTASLQSSDSREANRRQADKKTGSRSSLDKMYAPKPSHTQPSAKLVPSGNTALLVIELRARRRCWRRTFTYQISGQRSSRQGLESRRVKVPPPLIARFRRLAYPLLREATN